MRASGGAAQAVEEWEETVDASLQARGGGMERGKQGGAEWGREEGRSFQQCSSAEGKGNWPAPKKGVVGFLWVGQSAPFIDGWVAGDRPVTEPLRSEEISDPPSQPVSPHHQIPCPLSP